MRRQKLPAGDGRGDRAEEHPDDRPDRRRQDRDRAPAGAARAVAVPQGRGVEVHRGRLRRPRRRVDDARSRRARGRAWCARSGSPRCARRRSRRPRSACSICCCRRCRPPPSFDEQAASIREQAQRTREKLREQLRDGRLDHKQVEIDVREKSFPSFEIIAGSSVEEVDINVKDMLPGPLPGAHEEAARCGCPRRSRRCAQEEEQKLDRHGERRARRGRARAAGGHHLHRRDRQGRRPRRRPRARRQPRGRAARHPADRRGHDGQHEVRDGEDRSHPVHRRRRVPRLEAVGSDPGAAGALSDPRRARGARPRGLRPHPDRAEERARSSSTRRCSRPKA